VVLLSGILTCLAQSGAHVATRCGSAPSSTTTTPWAASRS